MADARRGLAAVASRLAKESVGSTEYWLAPEVVAQANRVMDGHCWTMPVLADGRLLLRDDDKVRCLDLRQK